MVRPDDEASKYRELAHDISSEEERKVLRQQNLILPVQLGKQNKELALLFCFPASGQGLLVIPPLQPNI